MTGTITGGTGINVVQLVTTADATIASPLALPTNFTNLTYAPAAGTKLTLADGFTASGPIAMIGSGTLANASALSGSGTIVQVGNYPYASGVFENDGTLFSSNYGGPAAVTVQSYATLNNTGTITASGNAVSSSYGIINNSGTIGAGDTAVTSFALGFTNTGSITAGNIGLILSPSCTCQTTTNAGLIAAGNIAVELQGGRLINSGTISSPGTAIQAGWYSTIVNQAAGVISGTGAAITGDGTNPFFTAVSNAGTINGNLNIATTSLYGYGGDTYESLGGTLNGNLTLGMGDTLITDLVNTGSGAFAGINGTVTANGTNLIYNVGSSATASATLPTGFVSLAYQLSNNATLTLDGNSMLDTPLALSGAGAVAFGGSLVATNAVGVSTRSYQTIGGTVSGANALTFTNNGAITAINAQTYGSVPAAVVLGGGDTLINNGSITFANISTTAGEYAVSGGMTITNTGTIAASGGGAVLLNGAVGSSLTNSGIIASDLNAINLVGLATITNSGTISSTAQTGIAFNPNYYYYGGYNGITVDNLAGGVIAGHGDAIDLNGATIDNAGIINGNVNLGSSYPYAYGPSVFVADGGMLYGNLTFGTYGGSLIETGAGFGVSGTISATGSTYYPSQFGHLRRADATVTLGYALPAGFGNEFTIASGAGTHVTLQGPAGFTSDIDVGGDGTIINDASTTGGVYNLAANTLGTTGYGALQLAGFVNNASVGRVNLTTNTLVNTGTVGSATAYGTVLTQSFNGALSFTNSGSIVTTPAVFYYWYPGGVFMPPAVSIRGTLAGAGTVSNSGTIDTGLYLNVTAATTGGNSASSVALTNAGTITGGSLTFNHVTFTVPAIEVDTGDPGGVPVSVTLNNSGTIAGEIGLFGDNNAIANAAGGTITGNAFLYAKEDAAYGLNGVNTLAIDGTMTGNLLATGGATNTIAIGGTLTGGIAATALTTNTLAITGKATGDIALSADSNAVAVAGTLTGNIAASATTGNTVTVGGTQNGNIALSGATADTVTVGGKLFGSVAFADAGADSLTVGGTMIGAITAGGGTTAIALNGAYTGNVDGGTGVTTLTVAGGNANAPVTFQSLANIAGYSQSGGTAAIVDTAALGNVAIGGGTLIGLVGSTITAPQITVGAHGRFASGGTVNGNVVVNGTLHPGASPDTMTVNGNVSLASGSTTVFEISPTASAKLVATGKVTIAGGTTLQITPLQVVVPGTTLQLITAGGGISGGFTTLTGIAGSLRTSGNALSLTVLYDTSAPQTPQVARGIAYVNTALANGAGPALLAGLPALTTANGAPNAAAFARLTPEAYASAMQIGTENGLILSRTARDIAPTGGLRSGHVFTFAQGMGNWRGISGDAGAGTSSADISGSGVLGGIGLAGEVAGGRVAIAAFGGYLDETQTIGGLGTATTAHGFAGGVTASVESGPARLAVSALRDAANARTNRALPDGTRTVTGYTLHSWTFDAQASARLALAGDWVVRPHVGTTWIHTDRAAASEVGSAAFDLAVAAGHHKAGFVDGGFRLETLAGADRRFNPYVDIGVRDQVHGRGSAALAGFAGGAQTLYATGARRSPASALVGLGGAYRVSAAVSLFATGEGEIAQRGSSANVMGGVRATF